MQLVVTMQTGLFNVTRWIKYNAFWIFKPKNSKAESYRTWRANSVL